jgi:hypothetical protein
MNYEEAENIPGMIEIVERSMLFSTLRSLTLEDGDSIIEFGPFFGRSTNCIVQGLLANKTYKPTCKFYTYDSFECDEQGWFAPHVRGRARAGGMEHLIEKHNKKLNFQKIFLHYMEPYLKTETVTCVKNELVDSKPPANKIAFIHIDSPKFYEEFKIILNRFFPKTKIGGMIIFQDFFYEWSATIILPVTILIKKGFLRLESSAATSLVCCVIKVPEKKDLREVEIIMNEENECEKYFDDAIQLCKEIKLDRAESYLPRLTLAKIQWQYSRGHFQKARGTIVRYLKEGNPFQLKLVDNFLELLANGFSIRHLFEKDHSKEDPLTLANSGKFEKDSHK